MNAIQPTQSNVASLPPPKIGACDLLERELPALPSFNLLQIPISAFRATRKSQNTRPLAQPLSRRLSLAIGPFLANALGVHWQTYRACIRSCQDDFSEKTVHKLRVATRRLIAQLLIVGCVTPGRTPEMAR